MRTYTSSNQRSNISSVTFDPKEGTMTVATKGGSAFKQAQHAVCVLNGMGGSCSFGLEDGVLKTDGVEARKVLKILERSKVITVGQRAEIIRKFNLDY